MNYKDVHSYLTENINSESSIDLLKKLKNNAKHNRIYSKNPKDKVEGFKYTYYQHPLYYAGQPYFCPNGWRRYSLDIGLSSEQFQKKYQNWAVAYHGTSSAATFSIFTNGFRSNHGCHIQQYEKAVYLTPSIVYASHPRYSKIEKFQKLYIQVVLQVRVKKNIFAKKAGTLFNTFQNCKDSVDPHYQNTQLQWVCKWNKQSYLKAKDGILVYGIMLKISTEDPYSIKENSWYTQYGRHN